MDKCNPRTITEAAENTEGTEKRQREIRRPIGIRF